MSPDLNRDWRLYAEDIIESCGKVRRYIAGMTCEAFVADERTRDAVMRNIEIIGEAAKGSRTTIAVGAPEVQWRNVRGMRDILAHGYFGASPEIVWRPRRPEWTRWRPAVRRLLGRPSGRLDPSKPRPDRDRFRVQSGHFLSTHVI